VLRNTVSLRVSLQVVEARVRLRTQLTPVGSHPRVIHGVLLQFAAARKTSAALAADVRSLSGVYAHVQRHFARHGEAPPAHGALVRPLPRVSAPVDLQLAGGHEGLAAVGAQVGLLARVDPHVDVQVARHGEALPAVRALERPLARVTARVQAQVVFVLERFAATHAHLRPLLPVPQLVGRQAGGGAEQLPAPRAPIGPLGGVDPLVGSQLAHTGAHLPTLPAGEDAALAVRRLVPPQQALRLEAFSALRTVKLQDAADALVPAFALQRLKAAPTFDANVGGFCAPRPPVRGQVRGPPEGLPALRALVRVFSGVQPLVLQQLVAVNEALSTLSAFVCDSLPRRARRGAGQDETLSGRRGSSAGVRRPAVKLLRGVNVGNAVTVFPFPREVCITVCPLLRRPSGILYPRRTPIGFSSACLCVRFHVFGDGLSW